MEMELVMASVNVYVRLIGPISSTLTYVSFYGIQGIILLEVMDVNIWVLQTGLIWKNFTYMNNLMT